MTPPVRSAAATLARAAARPPAGPLTASDLVACRAGDLFCLSRPDGEIDREGGGGQGLYFRDMLYVDRSALRVEGAPVRLVEVQREGPTRQRSRLAAPGLDLVRERRLGPVVRERLVLANRDRRARDVLLELEVRCPLESTYAARGFPGGPATAAARPVWRDGELLVARTGADGHIRELRLRCRPEPEVEIAGGGEIRLRWSLRLAPGGRAGCALELALAERGRRTWTPRAPRGRAHAGPTIETDNPDFDRVLARSLADAELLASGGAASRHLVAGLPWYAALFGRDALVSAMQFLPYRSDLALGTLNLLARHQGRRRDPARHEEPGKILHARRREEWANAGLVAHTPSFGTVDATPLFVILLAEYVRWTGDQDRLRRLRPALERALGWIERTGDHDGDGFLDYAAGAGEGHVENHGWKDSGNCIVRADGSLAQPPVALVEAQAYAYRALGEASWLHGLLGERGRAEQLARAAQDLRARFRAAFWMPRRRYLALALDRSGRLVDSLTSNPGHALWSGICDPPDASAITRRLLGRALFSGWGIRTLASGEAAYQPFDYHRGSVWPHDNAIAMEGMRRCGQAASGAAVFEALFEAALQFPRGRLPELFAGLPRRSGRRPEPYAGTCSPQAWAAGAIPAMLATALGLEPDAPAGRLALRAPYLPAFLGRVTVRGLRVGAGRADLRFTRVFGRTEVEVLAARGGLRVGRVSP